MPRRPGPPSPAQLDPTPPPPVHLAAHHTRAEVREHVAAGRWRPVRRGAYVEAALLGPDGHGVGRRLSLARTEALRRQSDAGLVVVRESAALLWGLPVVGTRSAVHVNVSVKPHSRGADDVVRHTARLPDEHRSTRHGIAVTTLERTVVDCALSLPPLDGLVIADAALHVGADRARIASILAGMVGARGVRRARAVVEAADDGAESPGETWARWSLLRIGLPAPDTQVPIPTPSGHYWADLGYPAWRVLVEYDGAAKYGPDGPAAVEALRAERRRQLAVEEAGWRVLRLTVDDRRRPDTVGDRLMRLLPRDAVVPLTPRPYLLSAR